MQPAHKVPFARSAWVFRRRNSNPALTFAHASDFCPKVWRNRLAANLDGSKRKRPEEWKRRAYSVPGKKQLRTEI